MTDAKTTKKNSIYEAVIHLIEERGGTEGVTVSEISAAAGIGKGTVYEYFASRDEIIAGAVIYWVNSVITEVEEAAGEHSVFEAKIKAVFNFIKNKSCGCKCFLSLFSSDFEGFFRAVNDEEAISCIKNRFEAFVESIAAAGKDYNSVPSNADNGYISYVIKSSILGYITLAAAGTILSGEEYRGAEEYALSMIMKAVA